jgi:hypothetical protein
MRTIPLLLGLALINLCGPPSHSSRADGGSALVAFLAPQTSTAQARVAERDACPVSQTVKDRPPDDPNASSFASPNGIWYANDRRTLWAWWWGKRSVGDYKVLWVRPVGAQLKISGRRLDGKADPLRAHIPAGYDHTYQSTALDFPSAGCWEIEGSAGDARLKFVVRIP